ncbi:MAG: cobalamin biosynthesis protein [Desulfohalobiaceae bacterium]
MPRECLHIAIYALTRPGAELAARLAESLIHELGTGNGEPQTGNPEQGTLNDERLTDNAERGTLNGERGTDLYLPSFLAHEFGGHDFSRLKDLLPETFPRYGGHIFVTAAGIAVRSIAPLLQGKERDPAVVVLDQKGEHAVSLLSGHLGGGNRLAREVAAILNGRAVITTATDTLGLPAVEELAREAGLEIADIRSATPVNAALANGRTLQLYDPQDDLGLAAALGPEFPLRRIDAVEEIHPAHAAVWVDRRRAAHAAERGALVLHPRRVVAGVGCNRGTDEEEILELIRSVFSELGLARESLACLASTAAKRDETGLIRAARSLNLPLVCLEDEDLKAVAVPNPSETVSKHMGVASVCEAAALHQARTTSLLQTKRKSTNVTLALALAGSWRWDWDPAGRIT